MPEDKTIDIGFDMHVRDWRHANTGNKSPVLLVHGLASNARTWDGVARELTQAGHPVVAIDQRGHGLSEKLPVESGYDFATITADLSRLLDKLGWQKPILAGQSWGGNVMLEMAAAYPGRAAGYVWVDGGFFNIRRRVPNWDDAYNQFKPPDFTGTPRTKMKERMREFRPDWTDEGIESSLANFETLPDGTIRPWLSLDRHMTIFRAMWEQDPPSRYAEVEEPVLICPAGNEREDEKRPTVNEAANGIRDTTVHWFPNTAHDIHVHRPQALAEVMLKWIAEL